MTHVADARMLAALSSARQLVDFLSARMDVLPEPENRGVTSHIGAALADSILQAGLRYNTVVSRRVKRIVELFPEAATVSGTIEVLSAHGPDHFLFWTHPRKIIRFMGLLCYIHDEDVETCADLYTWLDRQEARERLLTLTGIGPKTVDYLCSLVGLDCVAIDRHMRRLSQLVGIEQTDYLELKLVISYAADLMNVPRRKFDWWLWRVMSQKDRSQLQLI
jgi:3-methyladenine DNA glycosylase/8-oxoguanine DNA glycosylase